VEEETPPPPSKQKSTKVPKEVILDGSPVLVEKLANLNTEKMKNELSKFCFLQTVKSREQTKQVQSIMKHDFI